MISLSNGYFCFSSYQYRITVYTGNVSGGGTDAHVFLCLVGDQGDTGERALINCKNNVNKFEKGNVSGVSVELLDVLVFVHLSLWRSALQTQNVPLTLVFGSRWLSFEIQDFYDFYLSHTRLYREYNQQWNVSQVRSMDSANIIEYNTEEIYIKWNIKYKRMCMTVCCRLKY